VQVRGSETPFLYPLFKEDHMFGMFSTLFAMAQLLAAILMSVVVIGLAIMHPVVGVISFGVFYLLIVRPIWRWVKRSYLAEVRRQRG
jgi:hypothetical protein